jgi:ribonuclease T2
MFTNTKSFIQSTQHHIKSNIKLKHSIHKHFLWIASALILLSVQNNTYAQNQKSAIQSNTAPASCQIPNEILQNLSKPARVRVDFSNPSAPVDGYLLMLSWSPEYCAQNQHARLQCQINRFNWVAHGLWPQNNQAKNVREQPRFCQFSDVDATTIKQSLCTLPDIKLVQAQWQKHGSCAFKTPQAYFSQLQKLWQGIEKPALNSGQKLDVKEIKQIFTEKNKHLSADSLFIKTKGDYLSEVGICYDLNFNPRTCAKNNRGAPDFKGIKIR